jgi:hypothetical protein
LSNKDDETVKSELGPLTMSIIITYLSIWRWYYV